ncbi:MAG: hypothetical protein PHE67_12370 [Campylobacterales bacterium]|nr:hypothetical protein [Campylobacterales bacterium]
MVGNNLSLESVRDESSTSSYGSSVGMGVGVGKGGISSVSANASMNSGDSLNKKVVLSSITGDKVNIDTANNTNIKGSLIAAGSEDANGKFVDNGNLVLSTNTVTFSNLSNTSYSSSTGLQAGVSVSTTKGNTGVSSASYGASTSLGYSVTKTLATLGTGDITIKDKENSDDLARLNTDTSKVNKDLYSGGISSSVSGSLDTRLLTEKGRAEIKQDYKDMDKNMKTIADTLPDAKSDNKFVAAIGTIWDNVVGYTGGVLPSHGNNGGLLGEIPILTGNKDSAHAKLQVVSANAPLYNSNKDNFIPIEQSDAYKMMSEEQQAKVTGLYISKIPVEIARDNATYQNGANGILNDKGLAVANVLEQTGQSNKSTTVEATVFYNPSRGIVADLFESAVDKLGGTTGIAKQYGEFVRDTTTARGSDGSNFTQHSQANILLYSGINYINSADNTGAKFKPQSYFATGEVGADNKPVYKTPTFVSFGSPINSKDLNTAIADKTKGLNYTYMGAYTHSGDFVGEGVGGNSGVNGQASILDRINLFNTVKLFGGSNISPHSSYNPYDYAELKDVSGYKK